MIKNTDTLNPISLAFIGDAAYEVMVREHLVSLGDRPPEELHKMAVGFVSAQAQAAAVQKLLPRLSEEELATFKRGRNAKVSHVPKGASPAVYHNATGFEALFGRLFLDGNEKRMKELFLMITEGDVN